MSFFCGLDWFGNISRLSHCVRETACTHLQMHVWVIDCDSAWHQSIELWSNSNRQLSHVTASSRTLVRARACAWAAFRHLMPSYNRLLVWHCCLDIFIGGLPWSLGPKRTRWAVFVPRQVCSIRRHSTTYAVWYEMILVHFLCECSATFWYLLCMHCNLLQLLWLRMI